MIKYLPRRVLKKRMTASFRLPARGVAALFIFFILFAGASPAYALFVKYEGKKVTWSNTKLGGGPFQPTGWVEVNVPFRFTGDIPAKDFVSVSDVVVYGTYETTAWNESHLLLQASKVTFRRGFLRDINLVFFDPVGERLLVISGPPTPSAAIVNSPRPPCVFWPDFEDLDFCGARMAIKITTSTKPPILKSRVTIPPTPKPTYPAVAHVDVKGGLQFDANGGLFFDDSHSQLNRFGPFLLTATLRWDLADLDEPRPRKKRTWFTKVMIHHHAQGQTSEGSSVDFVADDDYWTLAGETFSWVQMNAFTIENLSEFCAELAHNAIGICDLRTGFDRGSGSLAFGFFDSDTVPGQLQGVGENFLLDLSIVVGLANLTTEFAGTLTHKANTVPVLESRED